MTARDQVVDRHVAGEHLRALRQLAGLSVRQAATASGLSDVTVYAWENGVKSPTLANLSVYAEGLGMVLAWDFRRQP